MKTLLNIFIGAFALTLAVSAQDKSQTPVSPGKPGEIVKDPESARNQFSGPITSVNREEKTITINDPKMGAHKLVIGDTTKLKRGDKDATWNDLKLGTKVEGICRGGQEKAEAESINIHE